MLPAILWAATTGSISGTVKDPSGAVIPGATVIATNTSTNIQAKTVTDDKGYYAFPSLSVGRYNVKVEEQGFGTQGRNNLDVDANGALVVDLTLEMAEKVEEVTVLENATQVETSSSQMGQVVTGTQMTAVALNGRSYTDLLALQPGIVPMSTQPPDSIVMAGASVAIAPSGGLNPGNQSISGQREDANGFMVNGGDVKELMNGGTTIVPDLDSIAEFRVLTNNFDAEYGNYSGGIVNVVTKSGGNQVHGSAFEFLRNTDLDARNFFSPERSFYRQNQFGGTVGGPIKKNKIFFFADYQGTRNAQGIDTGLDCRSHPRRTRRQLQRCGQHADRRRQRAVLREPAVAETGLCCYRERALLHGQDAVPARSASFPAPSSRKMSGPRRLNTCCNTFRFPTTDPPRLPPAPTARSCATTKAASAWTPTPNAWACCRLTISSTTTL